MSTPYRDRLLTVGAIRRRDRPVVREGKRHPESGVGYKMTEDEGSIVTEHSNDRVDAVAKVTTVHGHLGDLQARKRKADHGGQ